MKATELRIGNLVKRSQHSNWQERHWGEEIEVGYNEMYLCSLQETTDWYEPIPLTDEWFEKWGFYKDGEYWSKGIWDYKFCFRYRDWANNWAFYQEFTDSLDPKDDGKKYSISFDIEYVHQLQNLWFSLLHYEITAKED
jgi:hypothetical protein